ncbi:MAG TPA: hypothetical protein VEZ90_06090 [Blastocatellia bacterium]|nr:hypothetical protein [Blastocatellia bacterium]
MNLRPGRAGSNPAPRTLAYARVAEWQTREEILLGKVETNPRASAFVVVAGSISDGAFRQTLVRIQPPAPTLMRE